jgi:C4-dicarboxylate-specific signal transduction histidine kinase
LGALIWINRVCGGAAVDPVALEAAMGMKQRGVAIGVQPEVPNVSILADKIQIQQVLLNLMRNAVEAVSDQTHKKVELTVDREEDAVYISNCGAGLHVIRDGRQRLV